MSHETENESADELPASIDDHVEALCWQWAAWSRSRRHFGAPRSSSTSVLGRLTAKSRGRSIEPDAECVPLIAALNLAILAQPDDRARRVFEIHYLNRQGPIKAVASAAGMSKATWYRTIATFKARIYPAAQRILAQNLADARALPHYAGRPTSTER